MIFFENEITKFNTPKIMDSFSIKFNKFKDEFDFVRIFNTEKINFLIDWSYKLMHQELEKSIMLIGYKAFEFFICELLNDLPNYENISLGKLKKDGGIDFQGYEIINGKKIEIFGQVKLLKRKKFSEPLVRDLVGAIKGRSKSKKQKGIIICTSGFTKDAIAYAKKASPIEIDMIDLDQLKNILISNQIGIKKIIAEMHTIDEEYWEEIKCYND